MNAKPMTVPEASQEKADHLVQAIESAFQEEVKRGDENTLLTLAYSTDP